MSKPQRSLRLEKRSAKSLAVLSGAPGEIFFDNDNGTLRVYTDTAGDNIILANRTWVTANTFDGNYNNLTNAPVLTAVATSGDYNDLINTPAETDISTLANIGDTLLDSLQQDDALVWDGSLWTNRAVNKYSPANNGDWNSPAPTTISEALDRLAVLAKQLNNGTGA